MLFIRSTTTVPAQYDTKKWVKKPSKRVYIIDAGTSNLVKPRGQIYYPKLKKSIPEILINLLMLIISIFIFIIKFAPEIAINSLDDGKFAL